MKSLVAIAALLAGAPALALDMPLKLEDGATWTITAEHTHSKTDDGKPQAWTLRTVKQLTWSAPKNGKSGQVLVTPLSATAAEGSPPELAKARSFPIPALLDVDDTLAPATIVNVDEVRAAFAGVVGADITGQEEMADDAAMAMIASELSYASRSQGEELAPGEVVSYDDELPNPFGGPPIKAQGVYALESHDAAGGRAVVTWRQSLDPTSLRASLAQRLAEVIRAEPASRAEAEEAFGQMDVDRDDTCRHEIDLATGLAIKAQCRLANKVTAGGRLVESVDRWTITQTLPKTRP
jgi:hypothetical protein